jgi:2-furoyl-CoA dehydrogenase FAD binding subunit
VTQNKLLAWTDLKKKLPLLAVALPYVGISDPQQGTVCGSVRMPTRARSPVVPSALEGDVVLRGKHGSACSRPRIFSSTC